MKANRASETIDEYIAGFPPAVQKILEQVRATVRKAAPQAAEAIKYQIPTFTQNGNLVHFAAWQTHIGFYPAPRALAEFKDELAKYEGSKGAVKFPLDKPMPLSLISKIVKYRVRENLAKAAAKGKGK